MKVLVTGASGFLGAYVVKKLLEHGILDIRCLVRQRNKAKKLVDIITQYPNSNVEIFEGNLLRKDSAEEALKDVQVVYHCAAGTKGMYSDMFMDSVVASRNLLEAMVGKNIKRVVLVSSFSVYGFAQLKKMSIVNESTPLEMFPAKRDYYAYTKYKQERLFWQYYEKYHIPLVIVRPGVIYGPGGVAISTRVGVSFFGLFLFLGNNNILPLTYVENCAEAIVLAGQVPDIEGEAFNINDDALITCKEFFNKYRKEVKKIPYLSLPYCFLQKMSKYCERYYYKSMGQLPDILTPYKTASMWRGYRFDNSKIKKMLSWTPSISTKEGLTNLFRSLKGFD